MAACVDAFPAGVARFHARLLACVLGLVAAAPITAVAPPTASADSAAYNAAITRDAPASFWPLDDSAGTTVSDARGGNNGTPKGGVSFGQPGAMTGSAALGFDGNGWVLTPGNGLMTPAMTIEAWVKTTTGGAPASGPSYGFYVSRGSTGFDVLDTTRGFVNAAASRRLTDNRWHYIVGTSDPTGMALYVDGQRVGSHAPVTPNYGCCSAGAQIGSSFSNNPSFFKGQVDDVAIYDHALTSGQVASHFAAARGMNPPKIYRLRTDAVDVNQGVQEDFVANNVQLPFKSGGQTADYSGVPLVAGKETAVRVFGDEPLGPPGGVPVRVRLTGYRNGRRLPESPLSPTSLGNWPGTGDQAVYPINQQFPDWLAAVYHSATGGFDFELPPQWTTAGGITLRAEVTEATAGWGDPEWAPCEQRACVEERAFTLRNVTFQSVRPVSVMPVEVDWSRPGETARPQDPEAVFAKARALAPFGRDDLTIAPYAFKTDVSNLVSDKSKDESDGVNGDVLSAVAHDTYAYYDSGNPLGDIVIGVNGASDRLSPAPARGVADTFGFGLFGFQQPIAIVDEARPITSVGHELFHELGQVATGRFLPHAGEHCRESDGKTSNTPDGEYWPPNKEYAPEDDAGGNNGVGLDTSQTDQNGFLRLLGPSRPAPGDSYPTFFDLMSYCFLQAGGTRERDTPDAWISPITWTRIQRDFSRSHLASAGSAPTNRPAKGRSFAVFGTLVDGAAQLTVVDPAMPAAAGQGGPPSSSLALVLRDATGKELASSPLAVTERHNDNPAAPGTIVTFSGSVPSPAGAMSAQIVDQSGRVLGSRTRSPNAPKVRVTAPSGGSVGRSGRAVSIRWSASDADGDPLTARIEYSADGGKRFRLLFSGPSTGRTTLPARMFARARRARVRVTVNDGFNQTSALSRRFVSLGGAPAVEIVTAPTGPVRADATVPLEAVAFDSTGRRLPGRLLRWSAGKRSLGRGEAISVSGLKPGRNRVTVTARGAAGQTGRASVTIGVVRTTPALLVLRAVKPRAGQRRLVVQVAATEPGTLQVEGRRYAVGRKTRRIVFRLRGRLEIGRAISMTLRARGGSRTVALTPLALPGG